MSNLTKKSTKELILEAALKLFSANGYKATTVRDIAKEVGIQQSGLYNHFKNKDAILEELITDLKSSAIVTLQLLQRLNSSVLTGKMRHFLNS